MTLVKVSFWIAVAVVGALVGHMVGVDQVYRQGKWTRVYAYSHNLRVRSEG